MFVLCAILPLLTISMVTFLFVGHQLRSQAEKRLQQQCKNTGLLIYERLLSAEEELAVAARLVASGQPDRLDKNPFNRETREGSALNRIVLMIPGQGSQTILENVSNASSVKLGEVAPPGDNQTVISIRQGGDHYPHIFMYRKIKLRSSGTGILVAELSPLYLWGIGTEGALPPGIDMSVIMDERKILISSIPEYHIDANLLAARQEKTFSGSFESNYNGMIYMNSYWSLFLKHRFSSPQWTFVFSQSKASIMAPVSDFKFIFFLLVLLTFWIILLLSLRTIRNRTIPIERLKDGARQIAAGRFGLQLDVPSGDEFESLAKTFNEMSAKLEQSRNLLLQAAKMATFGQMSAGIVHEIGQPLSAISGYAELMKMGASPEKHGHFLSMICNETERLKTIISKFRTFSRVTEEVFSNIDLNEVLDKTLNLLDHQFTIKEIELEDIRTAPLVPVIGDSNGLQQAFLNLVTNALDAMAEKPAGQRRLRINTFASDRHVHVEIADSGDGIPEEIQPSIFDPFFTTKGEEKGTGLGLSITTSILHKHNAQIKFSSKVGEGTVFTLSFPAAADDAVSVDSP